jgi:hypothetical protein
VSSQFHAPVALTLGKSSRYQQYTMLFRPQRCREQKSHIFLTGIEPRFLGRPVRGLATILIYPGSIRRKGRNKSYNLALDKLQEVLAQPYDVYFPSYASVCTARPGRTTNHIVMCFSDYRRGLDW